MKLQKRWKKIVKLNRIFEVIDKYDFSNLDVCSKNELVDMLICYIKKISMANLKMLKNEIDLNDEEITSLLNYLDLIIKDKIPPQYVIGEVPFYNEKYIVTKDVLIPRQDTETLVEKAIEYINKYKLEKGLDMCTGSGVIGISIAKNSNIKEMTLVDISTAALKVAQDNILKNDVSKKIFTLQSDLFEKLMTTKDTYDIIVSNPPYIPTSEVQNLSEYVKNEPVIALDGGVSGLDFYEKIIKDARNFLNNGGFIAFEIGYNQMNDLVNIFNNFSEYTVIEKINDYNSNNRVIICRFHKI